MNDFEQTIERLKSCPGVDALVLGGSHASGRNDAKSDYDLYVYVNQPLAEEVRSGLLMPSCSYLEIGNAYWELEDDCILNNGREMEVIYRDLRQTEADLQRVLLDFQASNGYTTCLVHNVMTGQILFDREEKYQQLKEKYDFPYPGQLAENIIRKNRELLAGKIPSFAAQIEKAALRQDLVSINHRITEFLASYFDIIFALNRKFHPGEKRLISTCLLDCEILPADFEKNLQELLMSADKMQSIQCLLTELDELIRPKEKEKSLEALK